MTITVIATDPLVVSNNAYVTFDGDSLWSNNSDGSGTRAVSLWQEWMASMSTNVIFVYDPSHSGGTMDDRATNDLPAIVGFIGYQSNNNQHIAFHLATDNAGLDSNQMRLASSNDFIFPAYSSTNGTFPLTRSVGWMSNAVVQHVGVGYPPGNVSNGGLAGAARSGAMKSAADEFAYLGVDMWLGLVLAWTNDVVNRDGTNIQFNATGHFYDGGCGSEMMWLWSQTTPSLTNVSDSLINAADGSVVFSNNCAYGSVVVSGNTVTATILDKALAPYYAVPRQDGTLTNDGRGMFIINPSYSTFFNYRWGITNLTTGNYNVTIDDISIGTFTSTQLASRLNLFTNTVGPIWDQRESLYLRVLDWRYVDHKTLIPKSAGDGVGEVSVGSFSFTGMVAGKRGDDLIAFVNAKMTDVQTNFLPQYPQSIYAGAVPVIHTFKASLLPIYQPAPFR